MLPGDKFLNTYKIREEIYRGKNLVLRAFDLDKKIEVAVKISGQDNFWAFQKEFLLLNTYRNQGIVECYGNGIYQKKPYLILEYLGDGTIHQKFKKLNNIREKIKFFEKILPSLLKTLEYIHSHNILHRDIKPENILFKGEFPKFTDLGLANSYNFSPARAGGTWGYIAPEVLKGNPWTARSDFFSLGVTLYKCLFDELPFKGENIYSILSSFTSSNYRKKIKSIKEPYSKLLLWLLEEPPHKRPGTTKEVFEIIEGKWKPAPFFKIPPFAGRKRERKFILKKIKEKKKNLFITGKRGTGKTRLVQETRISLLMDKLYIEELKDWPDIIEQIPELKKSPEDIKTLARMFLYKKTEKRDWTVLFVEDIDKKEQDFMELIESLLTESVDFPVCFIITGASIPLSFKEYSDELELGDLKKKEKKELIKGLFPGIFVPDFITEKLPGNPSALLSVLKKLYQKGKIEKGKLLIEDIPPYFKRIKQRKLNIHQKKLVEFIHAHRGRIRESHLFSYLKQFQKGFIHSFYSLIKMGILKETQNWVFLNPDFKINRVNKRKRENILNDSLSIFAPYADGISPYEFIHYSLLFLDAGKKKKAEELFERGIREIFEKYGALSAKIFIEKHRENFKGIQNSSFLELKGDIYSITGDYKRAEKCYNRLLKSCSVGEKRIKIHRKIAELYFRKGEISEYIKKNREIYKETYSDQKPEILNNIAWGCILESKYEMALKLSRRALRVAEKTNNQKQRLLAILHRAQVYEKREKKERADKLYRSVEKSASLRRMKDILFFSNYFLGSLYETQGNLENAEKKLKKALKISREIGDVSKEMSCLNTLGLIFKKKKEFSQAEDFYKQMMELAREVGNEYIEAASINNMANIEEKRDSIDSALELYKRALFKAEKIRNRKPISIALNNIGNIYRIKGDLKKAQEFLERALEIKKEWGTLEEIGFSLLNLLKLNYALKEYEKAEACAYEAIEVFKEKREVFEIIGILGKIYIERGENDKCIDAISDYLKLTHLKKDKEKQGVFHLLLSLCYFLKGNIKKAIEHFDKGNKFLSEIEDQEKKAEIYLYFSKRVFESKILEDTEFWAQGFFDLFLSSLENADELYHQLKDSQKLSDIKNLRLKILQKETGLLAGLPGEDMKLKALIRAMGLLNKFEDSALLSKKFLDLSISILKAERGIFVYKEQEEMVLKSARNIEKEDIKEIEDFSRSVIRESFIKGVIMHTLDASKDPKLSKRESIIKFNIKSILCVPVVLDEEVMGVIYLDSKKERAFTKEDRDFLYILSNLVSISLERLRMLEELKRAKKKLEIENIKLREEIGKGVHYEELIGKNSSMRELFRTTEKIIRLKRPVPILILGETGTGKELVARIIHNRGYRKNEPFVTINCGSLPETLMESELFGYKKGAFTGANSDKPGLFEVADRGTIFLDQIESLPVALQVKLLRALQYGEIRRVGDTVDRKVDVRVIAAANENLDLLVERGLFRKDLRFRFSTVQMELPPLRKRKEDIPLLVKYFMKKFKKYYREKKYIEDVSEEVLALFMEYPWPGNIRELENILEGAFILCDEKTIKEKHLPSHILEWKARKFEERRKKTGILDETERERILEAFKKFDGNKSKMADFLGINRTTLYRKMKRFGIV